MSRTTKIVLIVIVGLIVIAGIVVLIIKTSAPRVLSPEVREVTPVEKVSPKQINPTTNAWPAPTDAEKQTLAIKNLAASFTERFGTYTNQSDYASIVELTNMMTKSMTDWTLNSYIPGLKKAHDPAGFFYRIITKAPSVVVSDLTSAKATATVATDRQETSGTNPTKDYIQNMVLNFVKQGDQWLVDAAFWK